MELKEKMTLKEIGELIGRGITSIQPKLENKHYFSNIKQIKQNGTRFYCGITTKNINDLEKLYKMARTRLK